MAQLLPEPEAESESAPGEPLDGALASTPRVSAPERPSAAGEADAAGEDTAEATEPDPLALAKDVVQFASDKGGADILLMDIRKLSIIADYFVICSGDNERQIRAISRGIQDGVDEQWGFSPRHRGRSQGEQAGWVLLDYGGVVVHVFSPQMREFYRLERLWSEAATLLRMQ